MTDAASRIFARTPENDILDHLFGFDDQGSTSLWPRLADLVLSDLQLDDRRHGIGGSDANIIFSGNQERIRRLWSEKRGELEPADLSQIVAVALGSWTEPFNRQWFERQTGQRVKSVGATAVCPVRPWRRCTLDGLIAETGAVWEAKHTSAFSSAEEVLQRYMPQLQHNMAVIGADLAVLSVIFGNQKFEILEIASDWVYQLELLEAEADFWECVESGREPIPFSVPLPPRPVGVREVCLEGNNAWASAAADWVDLRDSAKRHASAVVEIKSLVEPDVARAFGHGIEAKRSKAGAISIRELAQ